MGQTLAAVFVLFVSFVLIFISALPSRTCVSLLLFLVARRVLVGLEAMGHVMSAAAQGHLQGCRGAAALGISSWSL